MSETGVDPDLAGFAAMMAGAGQDPGGADPAPYGYTTDPKTGEERPKKSPGRPRKTPGLDELKAQRDAAGQEDGPAPAADRPPAAPEGRRRRGPKTGTPRAAPPVPQSLRHEGAIAKGVNQAYRRMGRLIRVMDPEVGAAVIECTRAEDPEDVTVGDAWEQLAKVNPRVRAFLLRALTGGAWSAVFMAHAPILGAVLMKDSVRRRVPFTRLAMAMVDDEDQGPGESPGAGTPFDGLRPEDMAAMMAMAQQQAEQMMGRGAGVPGRGDGGQPGS